MALLLAQTFPLGRFHATRWNQNPFEDPHGEWPPSPWRFLRALAARWIQYSRETGDDDAKARDDLLAHLAHFPPAFHLPPTSWRGSPELRQYQPTEVTWTDASAKGAAYKKPKTTLVSDHFRVLPSDEPVYWFWEALDLSRALRSLLNELLRRMHYFGRAESFCRFLLLDAPPANLKPNCILGPSNERGAPVLVADPRAELSLESLLAATDDRLVAGRRIPPGAVWYYAEIPPRGAPSLLQPARRSFPANQRIIQFAVGGRVYPPLARWVKITTIFRNKAVAHRAGELTHNWPARYDDLDAGQRDALALLVGKDANGIPLSGHQHAFFALLPDDQGRPTRFACWRQSPFGPEEVEAILAASRAPYSWDSGAPDWLVGLVPLPFETPPPSDVFGEADRWISATPLVLPTPYIRFRANGRERPGATVEQLVRKLLIKNGYPDPVKLHIRDSVLDTEWVYVHETAQERRRRARVRTSCVRPAFFIRLVFPHPVCGPVCLGHSCHFGLGLFVRDRE
jgi:CRISPR-associated protein Csb2